MATKIYKYDLKQLIKFIETKNVAIPEFQRGFVWRKNQVKDLFDSLIKKYPVGGVIIWKTGQRIDARTLNGEKLPKTKYLILDGQQRMTSIYYLFRQKKFLEDGIKDKFHEICENRERQVIDFEKFKISKLSGKKVLDYSKGSHCELDPRKFYRLVGRGYKFPIIVISLNDFKQAIQVFERINQAGTKISTESIFLSETWNRQTDIGKKLRYWKKENKDALSSKIDTVIFIHVFAIVLQLEKKVGIGGRIEISITALKKIAEKVQSDKRTNTNRVFSEVIGAVGKALQYLKEEYGLVDIKDLPSQTMVTVLSVFFYYRKLMSKKQKSEIRKWFWRSSLSNRYIGSGYTTNINGDVKAMKVLGLTGKKLKIPKATLKIFSQLEDVDLTSGRSTFRNIFKQALWQQEPTFINGDKVSRKDVETGNHNPEDDHFFPRRLQKNGFIGNEINNILNIHFLNRDENRGKTGKRPSEWLEENIAKTNADENAILKYFKSQLLPFKTLKELRRCERALLIKNKRLSHKQFIDNYWSFRWKRYQLFQKALDRLQDGKLK